MRLPAKCDVRDAITPPPRSVRVPPVGGRPRGLTRVGCCESHRPSNRSVSVWASETFQSNRRNATALSVVRLSERPWTCAGAPLAAASARNREAESGLTPSRARVRGSAEASDGSACPRQRPCSAPNTNSLLRTIGPPIPPLSWFWVYPCPNGDVVTCPQARERSRSVYVNDPCGMFLPLRVVEATRPPENWPRAASWLLVTTRVERIASCGTLPPLRDRPSSVIAFAVGRWPATEKSASVESVAASARTP